MTAASSPATCILPGIGVSDPHVAVWIRRVCVMLRREVCWCWNLRGNGRGSGLPPPADAASENLDLVRFESEKARFFETDETARYLTAEMEALQPPPADAPIRGRWSWLVKELELDQSSQFLLAFVLTARLDAALAPVLAACLNDSSRAYPTAALAQRLWPEPDKIIACTSALHPLFRTGLLFSGEAGSDVDWLAPIETHADVAHQLAWPDEDSVRGLRTIETNGSGDLPPGAELLVERLRAFEPDGMEAVPIVGEPGTAFDSFAAAIGEATGRGVALLEVDAPPDSRTLAGLATLAWLRGVDVLLPEAWLEVGEEQTWQRLFGSLHGLPLRWYAPIRQSDSLTRIARGRQAPPFHTEPLSFEERVERFRTGLGPDIAVDDAVIEECARRFRVQEKTIDRITSTFRVGRRTPDLELLLQACRNEAAIDMGGLAQLVVPRFQPEELILPPKQRQQFEEILHAMRALTEVHYRWGTAKVWNEAGLAALFFGAPGTGKTMAAEILSAALDLPMYRVDLSQVVNKYIGETEKNLKRIFDAAEVSDCILFFDEADALFGKRTDVKDAHDRYANIEVSYLLERMERFKGFSILATNRKKDLDEAFVRRIRFVVEFPQPAARERERIWRQAFPAGVDVSDLDIPFLARQFSLCGGHIRSIAFAACLQSARRDAGGARKRVAMADVVVAVKRELEKMNRAAGESMFGPYGGFVRELEQ